jgi:hypothetical protein
MGEKELIDFRFRFDLLKCFEFNGFRLIKCFGGLSLLFINQNEQSQIYSYKFMFDTQSNIFTVLNQ